MCEVSIITAAYNAEEFIGRTIQSAIYQSFKSWEMIIVDDFSTDHTSQIVETYAKLDKRIKLIRLAKNSGAAVARNSAIKAAKGRYIAFLDSDDLWLPNKLEVQTAFMREKGCAFSFTAYERINESDDILSLVGVPERVSYRQMLKTSVIGCLTAMYDTEYFGKVYMPLIRKRQDYGLWLKLLKNVDYAYGIPQALARYRVRSGSISSNKLNTATYNWKLYRDVEQLSIPASCYYFSHYAIRGLLRSKFPRLAKMMRVMD